MGYTHGFKWTDEKVEKEIKNVMSALNINRMPTNLEIKSVMKNNSLSCKISKNGGYKVWASKLGLGIKDSETKFGNDWEFNVKNELESKGYIVEKMSTKHPYDLLVNNNIKVDVKVSRYYNSKRFKYHTFNLEKKHHNCDIFICIGLNEQDNLEKILVVPSKYLMGIKQLSVGVKSKYDKFKDRWGYIEKYSYFYDVTI